MSVNEAFDGGFDQCGVAWVVLIELVIDDESFAGFTKPELVAELDLGSGFTTFDDVDLIVVEAEDFFFGGDAAATDDAFASGVSPWIFA